MSVLIAGCGDSGTVAELLVDLIRHDGPACEADPWHGPASPRADLAEAQSVLLISSSGSTPEVLDFGRQALTAGCEVVAVTAGGAMASEFTWISASDGTNSSVFLAAARFLSSRGLLPPFDTPAWPSGSAADLGSNLGAVLNGLDGAVLILAAARFARLGAALASFIFERRGLPATTLRLEDANHFLSRDIDKAFAAGRFASIIVLGARPGASTEIIDGLGARSWSWAGPFLGTRTCWEMLTAYETALP